MYKVRYTAKERLSMDAEWGRSLNLCSTLLYDKKNPNTFANDNLSYVSRFSGFQESARRSTILRWTIDFSTLATSNNYLNLSSIKCAIRTLSATVDMKVNYVNKMVFYYEENIIFIALLSIMRFYWSSKNCTLEGKVPLCRTITVVTE